MKKIVVMGVVAFVTFTACQKGNNSPKNETVSEEIVNVEMNSGESFKYNLPESSSNANFATVANHASSSKISITPGTNESTYEYVASENYHGQDLVSVQITPIATSQTNQYSCQNTNNNQNSCGKHHDKKNNNKNRNGSCGNGSNHGENQPIKKITFKFNIKAAESTKL